jgi:hypothetical protein
MRSTLLRGSLAALALAAAAAHAEAPLAPAEARAIAKEATVYGFPLVDSYRIQHAYFVDRADPEYKGAWNQVHSTPRVYTPADKAVQTPNSDTPYSAIGLDLRAEPIVLTVPAVEKGRYFSVQLIDLYTHNFAYLGSRTTGNGGGSFLIAGPEWQGEKPAGIEQVIPSETELVLALYRTQLFSPADLENVKRVQAGYRAQPLSQFASLPPGAPAPEIRFVAPLTPEEEVSSLRFFEVLNFVLGFCPTVPSEQALMARFARLNVGPGRRFDAEKLSPELRQAVSDGMADAWKELAEFKKTKLDTRQVTSSDLFGTREHLRNNYLYRMAAAKLGIYGNSAAEALYPSYTVDASGAPLDASKHRYALRFAPGQLPPVNAFWSLTMYELPESLLVANPLHRYLINSPMLPQLVRDADGGVTLFLQHESPGQAKEPNWLPAPQGPFMAVLRLYWPKEEALSGKWQRPALETKPLE